MRCTALLMVRTSSAAAGYFIPIRRALDTTSRIQLRAMAFGSVWAGAGEIAEPPAVVLALAENPAGELTTPGLACTCHRFALHG